MTCQCWFFVTIEFDVYFYNFMKHTPLLLHDVLVFIIVANTAIYGYSKDDCYLNGAFDALLSFSFPRIIVHSIELLSCLRQQESNQRNAVSLQNILVSPPRGNNGNEGNSLLRSLKQPSF